MLQRLWNLLCSLKLAIVLASAATLLLIGGSVIMLRYPKTFGEIDSVTLGEWMSRFALSKFSITWWFLLACLLIVLLGINTLCCFCDWLPKFRARWRKSGEYLIHLGFVLVLIAFIMGSVSGGRSENHRLRIGETIDLSAIAPGYTLRLDAFAPEFTAEGRPDDLKSTLTLFRNDEVRAQQQIRINHPLMVDSLVILPASLNQIAEGFRFDSPSGPVELKAGSVMRTEKGMLRVLRFYPDAVRSGGTVVERSDLLQNPAFELEVISSDNGPQRFWYHLREGVPQPLVAAGLTLRPTEPLAAWVSILTVNRDPGDRLALLGGLCLGLGSLFALFSFYDKRQRGDRPDVI